MQISHSTGPVLFIPHGGGPLPLLKDENHKTLVNFLKEIKNQYWLLIYGIIQVEVLPETQQY